MEIQIKPQKIGIELGAEKVYPALEKVKVRSRAKEQVIKPTQYGFSEVTVEPLDVTLQDKEITENGAYEADSEYDGLGKVTVNVSEAVVEQIYSYSEEVWN